MSDFSHLLKQANLIGDQWVGADSGAVIEVTNPATGEVIGAVPNAGAAETSRAIEAAHAAFPAYAAMPLAERVRLMRLLHEAILDHREALAAMLTAEQGKPLAEARGEITIGAEYVRWFAEVVRAHKGEIVPSPTPDRRFLVTRHPVGVVGAITPWNFPFSMLARKVGPALAVGCTTVAKPASATPFSGLVWGHLAREVGFPPGVLNVVTGSARAIGGALLADPRVRKITFTGSTEVGKELIRGSADTVKRVSMELGGNAPFIVFDDADLDAAVEGALASKYRNSGQTCVCANRIYVQAGIHDAFVERLAEATRTLKVGPGWQEGVVQGPLIDEAAACKVEEFVADAVARGAKVMTGGRRHPELGGTFYEPTVVAGATDEMKFATEEIFGPLAPVFRFETEEEVVARANATRFGLAAYVYTRDLARIFRLDAALQYGMIGFNAGIITAVEAPFGGVKESGLGREGGTQGLDEYLDLKYLCIAGL